MGKRDIDRIIEAKYCDYTDRAIADVKALQGAVWTVFAEDMQRGHSIVFAEAERLIEGICERLVQVLPPAELELLWFGCDAIWDHDEDEPGRQREWEEGVSRELYKRVCSAADNLDLDEPDEGDGAYSVSEDDALILSNVAEMLEETTNRDGLSPADLKALKRTIAALKAVPSVTPGIDVRISIGQRLGTGDFRETRFCVVEINSQHLEVSSGGQYEQAVGSDSFRLDSFEWFPWGERELKGDTDDWLGLLSCILVDDPRFSICDDSDEDEPEAQDTETDPHNAGDPVCAVDHFADVVDRSRIDRVLWQIWTEYRHDLEAERISEVQDLRAFGILWVATFMPEVVSVRFRATLAREVGRYRERPDYWSFCRMRTLPIEAALYSLTGEESWLDTFRFNLGHHKQSQRLFVTESLALVANRFVFDGEMLSHVARNLELAHLVSEWPVILFAISRGDPFWKRQQIQSWLDSYEVNGGAREVLEKLARGEVVNNPFLNRLLRIQQFLTLRLARLASASRPPVQTVLPGLADDELDRYDGSPNISGLVWQRLSEHPLTSSTVKIEGVGLS